MLNSIARGAGLRTQSSTTITIPAPIGGWNARDSLGAMPVGDAVTLTNWWPGTNSVVLRYGYTKHATGITGQVESVIAYSGGTTNKLFAAAGTNIYVVTAGGAVGSAVVSSLTNARWQYINMRTASSYLMMVNGADKLRFYDGTNWAKDGDEPKMRLSIYQTDLQYALMKCIQEQQALITQLTARITALETT